MNASHDDSKPLDRLGSTSGLSAWAPFRSRDFTRMASAQFVSNVGSWMQTVGAQELMLTLTTSATLVALIQTAAGLPVVLLAVPAGAIGDLVDRRRLLIAAQSFMLLAAMALAVLALAGLVTPWVLLALIFAVGVGQTLTSPTWQTLQPELVAPEERTQAIALGAVNQNLSRAVGPAIGGALYAATSAAALFFVNALSFVPVLGAVARWHGGARPTSAAAPEHVTEAIRAGARYIAGSPRAARDPAARRAVHGLRQLDLGVAAARRTYPVASRLRRLRPAARGAWASARSPVPPRCRACAGVSDRGCS